MTAPMVEVRGKMRGVKVLEARTGKPYGFVVVSVEVDGREGPQTADYPAICFGRRVESIKEEYRPGEDVVMRARLQSEPYKSRVGQARVALRLVLEDLRSAEGDAVIAVDPNDQIPF